MRNYVAPVISALVIIVLAAGYAVFFFMVIRGIDATTSIKAIVAAAALFVVIGVSVALVSRIKELRGGQEDDLGVRICRTLICEYAKVRHPPVHWDRASAPPGDRVCGG